eukprot:NODE_1060_length_1613_cov_0.428666.p1 type:complete len:217 gc:universal NODE_1060_length_1613_cov_0.428666:369-1019(+)
MSHIFKTKAELASSLCKQVDSLERTHFKHWPNKPFVVAIAGGSLPSLLAGISPSEPAKWRIILADERIVPISSAESNTKLLYEHLPIPKDNVITINPELDPTSCSNDYEAKIKDLLPLNLALLGMGPDGHICSLFPNHALLKSNRIVDYLTDSPKPPSNRVTLTFPILNNASTITFMITTGQSKRNAVKRGMLKDMELPVSRLTNVTWWLDEEAAP